MRRVLLEVCLLIVSHVVEAREPERSTHVRAELVEMRRLIADAAERSVTIRALIDALDDSDVIVYVRPRPFQSVAFEGRTVLLGVRGRRRFLVVELACPGIQKRQMATLAHELQHVVEIARAGWVVDAATLARYYGENGLRVDTAEGVATFETEAARRVGVRADAEIWAYEATREPSGARPTQTGDRP